MQPMHADYTDAINECMGRTQEKNANSSTESGLHWIDNI